MTYTQVLLLDEVDLILHPLKSELNWPLGAKEPLDFTTNRVVGNGLRWCVPLHMLDALFSCRGDTMCGDFKENRKALGILDKYVGELSLSLSLPLSLETHTHTHTD
jgi:hypothetical protein